MNRRAWLKTVGAAALVVAAGAATEAAAQSKPAPKKDLAKKQATTSDKKNATKEGVAGSLGSKEIDAEKLPGKLEVGFAFGSVAVMVAVLKFL